MRAFQKVLIDFDGLDSFIKVSLLMGYADLVYALQAAKRDMLYCHAKDARSFAVLVTYYDNNNQSVEIVPATYSL